MDLEIEATFVDIDKDKLRIKLNAIGAKLIQPETLMRRVVFNVNAHSASSESAMKVNASS